MEQPRDVTTDGRNTVSAVVELIGAGGPLGVWMVSTAIDEPQRFEHNGRSYWIAMRPERFYRPYSIELVKFTHERHPGTEMPSRFASRVRLKNPQKNEDREVVISMNQPLRYAGETFYQASFANDDRTSILQVVRNPGWLLPYLACAMVGAGLIWQFVSHLARRVAVKTTPRPVSTAPLALGVALVTALLAGAWLVSGLWHFIPRSAPDLDAFASLPVMADGRLKCFGTLGSRRAADNVWKTKADDSARAATRCDPLAAHPPGAAGIGGFLSCFHASPSRPAGIAGPAARSQSVSSRSMKSAGTDPPCASTPTPPGSFGARSGATFNARC